MASIAQTGHRTDEQYYEVAPPRSLGERLAIAARDRIYDDMIRCCRPARDRHHPGCRGLRRRQRRRQHAGAEVSASGPHHRRGPGRRARPSAPPIRRPPTGGSRPTGRCRSPTRRFDIAVSNAVLEHVGSRDAPGGFRPRAVAGRQNGLHQRAEPVFSGRASHRDPAPAFLDAGASRCACRRLGKAEWADEAQSDPDVPAAARRAGACRVRARHRHHRHRAWAVQLKSLSVDRWLEPADDRPGRAGKRPSGRPGKAIKSLRRKASLLYEPRKTRRRSRGKSFNLGVG